MAAYPPCMGWHQAPTPAGRKYHRLHTPPAVISGSACCTGSMPTSLKTRGPNTCSRQTPSTTCTRVVCSADIPEPARKPPGVAGGAAVNSAASARRLPGDKCSGGAGKHCRTGSSCFFYSELVFLRSAMVIQGENLTMLAASGQAWVKGGFAAVAANLQNRAPGTHSECLPAQGQRPDRVACSAH